MRGSARRHRNACAHPHCFDAFGESQFRGDHHAAGAATGMISCTPSANAFGKIMTRSGKEQLSSAPHISPRRLLTEPCRPLIRVDGARADNRKELAVSSGTLNSRAHCRGRPW